MENLMKVVEADCRYFEAHHNADRMMPEYLKVVPIPDTDGWYALMLNERPLWSGTLAEINIAVKTLCKFVKVDERRTNRHDQRHN